MTREELSAALVQLQQRAQNESGQRGNVTPGDFITELLVHAATTAAMQRLDERGKFPGLTRALLLAALGEAYDHALELS